MSEKVDLDDLDISDELKRKAKLHEEVTDELYNTFVLKNHDYGDSFSKTFKEIGEVSALTRICDKINRLKSIVKNDSMVDDESKEDTIKDAANYLIMWAMNLDADDGTFDEDLNILSSEDESDIYEKMLESVCIRDENDYPRSVYRWALITAVKMIEQADGMVTPEEVLEFYEGSDAYKLEISERPTLARDSRRCSLRHALRYGFYLGWFSRRGYVGSKKVDYYGEGEDFEEILRLTYDELPLVKIIEVNAGRVEGELEDDDDIPPLLEVRDVEFDFSDEV